MKPRRRWALSSIAAGLILGASVLGSSTGAVPVTARISTISSADAPTGLRVFARASDLRLENAEVTAVVRAKDGQLVDFLRQNSVLPTGDALGATTRIDGLWEFGPLVVVDGTAAPRAELVQVQALADRVRVTGVVRLATGPVSVQTDYVLDPARARLVVSARFWSALPLPPALEAGLEVRWGNTAYFVSGHAAALSSFEGLASWVGRRGAGGDLLLRALEPGVFAARFSAKDRGFVPALRALQPPPGPGAREVSARFELAYEPLPLVAEQTAPTTTTAPTATVTNATARLELEVRDQRGRLLPSKLSLKGERPAPLFPDFGGLDGTDRFVWTGNGRIGRELPPGVYELFVSAGPEHEAFRERVELRAGITERRKLVLRHVMPTPGWIAADLHLHQAPSVDADLSLESRLIAVAAEGVEFAVASDHYVVTDFAPVVASMRKSGALSRPLVTVAGTEVSTVGQRFGHFNLFPIARDQNVEYEDTTPSRLFASARRASPTGILQVNHPRHDPRLGYFIAYDLDPETGFARRPGFDPAFDAIEVFNGFHVQDQSLTAMNLRDFLHLLGSGRRYVATGSSDSHQLAFLDPGLPRTWIAWGGANDDADAAAPAGRVLDALKAGRAVVSSGPLIEASIAGAGPGETAHHVGKLAQLRVRVRAAPWVSTRTLQVLEGSSGLVRHTAVIEPSERVVRYEGSFPLPLAAPSFVVVTVTGDAPLPNTSRSDVVPFAFTNPIWIEP